MQTAVVIKDTTIDDAFINIQKRQCGAVYASAADLKTLTAALARNDIPYAFSSLWNLPADVEREDAALAEKARIAAQEEHERKQRNADQSRLRISVRKTSARRKPRNKPACDRNLATAQRRSQPHSVPKSPRGQRTRAVRSLEFYPTYAAWLTDKLADHWEIMTIDTEVQDFGTSTFKSRALNTDFRPDHPASEKQDARRI